MLIQRLLREHPKFCVACCVFWMLLIATIVLIPGPFGAARSNPVPRNGALIQTVPDTCHSIHISRQLTYVSAY